MYCGHLLSRGISMTSSTFVSSSGDGYEIQMGRWSRRLAPMLIEFAGVGQGRSILDVGCGTGNLALALLQSPAIGKVYGIDFSPAYIDHATNRIRDSMLHSGGRSASPNPSHDEDMRFRIGINQGDVVIDDSRVYGEGVAARLENFAEPGGICICRKVSEELVILY